MGLSIPNIHFHGSSASAVILVEGNTTECEFGNLQAALAQPDTSIRLFGKPEVVGKRRMGVGLARADSIEQAIEKALAVAAAVEVKT